MPSELLFHPSWLLTSSGVFSLSGGTETELAGRGSRGRVADAPFPQLPADEGERLIVSGDGAHRSIAVVRANRCLARVAPSRTGNGEAMRATSPASFRSEGASMAYGWQDLPFRASVAYRHSWKPIGGFCWSGRGLAHCCSRATKVADRSACMCAVLTQAGGMEWKVVQERPETSSSCGSYGR
jgi:hypothetical protein